MSFGRERLFWEHHGGGEKRESPGSDSVIKYPCPAPEQLPGSYTATASPLRVAATISSTIFGTS
jgi:hypothetical protein